ncbi:MAG: hypothetical protein Q9161_007293 [Pseudevernia consocians]
MVCSKTTVGQIYSLLAGVFTAVNTHTITSPSQTLSSTFATSPLVNTTTLDTTIDPRFGFTAVYGETTLPLTPCFMNVVELLAQYAELDWLSRARERHGVVLPEYPQVEIAVLPAAPATSVEVRLVVWGIWVGIRDIISRRQFYDAEFEVLWEGEVVAYIYITGAMDPQVTGSNGTLDSDEPLTLLPSPNETTSGILGSSNGTQTSSDALNVGTFNWRPYFTPEAKALTVTEVFLTVMAGLKNAAPHPASDKVPGPYASAAMDVYANVQFYLHRRRTPRTRPPYFQYIHIIKALRLVPGYMLEKKRFCELFFSIEVSSLPVGEGYLEKGHYVPPRLVLDAVEPKKNESFS